MAVRWETVMADMGNKRGMASERGMESALGWDVEEEVRIGGVKLGGTSTGGFGGRSDVDRAPCES